MSDFYAKLAELSPERRRLLEQKLAAQGRPDGGRPDIRPRRGDAPAPLLSFAQKRLWFMQQLEPGNTAYNMKTVLRFRGRLDAGALDRAFAGLVRRHESLRTRFALAADGEPRQIVEHQPAVTIRRIDLSGIKDAEVEAKGLIEDLVGAAYDLADIPLRAALLRLSDQGHLLAIGLHHIAGDRWSMGIFGRDLSVLYMAELEGGTPQLPVLPVQYADWAIWQNDTIEGPIQRRQLDYWRGQLSRELPVLALPFDRPRSAVARFDGAQYPVAFDRHLSTRLRDFASRQNVSLFTVLLAGCKILLHLYTDSDDIVVGSEVANRDRPETQAMIGPLVNTLVLRSDLSGDPRVTAVLKHVADVVRGGLAHQDVPFERVVEAVNPERSLSDMTPLFQVKFDLQHRMTAMPGLRSLTMEPYQVADRAAKNELRFNLEDEGADITGRIEYATALFDEATIARLVRHFEHVLLLMLDAPDHRLSMLDFLSTEERHAIIASAEGPPPVPSEDCVHTLFERQAAATPEACAVTDGRNSLTYGSLAKRVEAIAAVLVDAGMGPGHRVGICMRRTPDLIAALLGVLTSGAAYVPLDPSYPAERLALIAEDAGLEIVLSDLDGLPFETGGGLRSIDVNHLPAVSGRPLPTSRPEDLAYVIYTSGSTGRPKGVAIEHRSVVSRLLWAREQFSAEELSGVLASTSICFDLSVFEIFAPLAWGGRIVLVDNLPALPSLSDDSRVTLVNTVPSLMRELLRHDPLPPTVKTVVLCGEPLPAALVERLRADPLNLAIHNLYGPSEDTIYSTGAALHGDGYHGGTVPIGVPLPGSVAYVLDRAGRLRPAGLAGELYLTGSGLARGYLGRPGLTGERFVPDPWSSVPGGFLYRTGDRVRRRADGVLEFLGRLDHQVKVRGFRIEVGEIEYQLERIAEVGEAVVIVVGAEGSPERQLAAFVSAKPDDVVGEAQLRAALEQVLPAYMVPTLWCFLRELPHLPNGKVDRSALPARIADMPARKVPPGTDTERRIVAIWSDLLRVEDVGIDDNFFRLGGHSLGAMRLSVRLHQEFGVELSLAEVFGALTPRAQAKLVDDREHACTSGPIPVIARNAAVETLSEDDVDAMLSQLLKAKSS